MIPKSEEYLAGYKITYKAPGFTGTTTRRSNPESVVLISVVIRMTVSSNILINSSYIIL